MYFVLSDLEAFVAHDISLGEKSTFFEKIKIRGMGDMASLLTTNPQGVPYTPTHQVPKKNLSVLKSNLQKCVRRGLSSKAIKSALAIYSISPIELLRRLPVIMVEDAIPVASFTTIVWFMMAVSKGYVMDESQISWLMGVVYMMCKSIETNIRYPSLDGAADAPSLKGLSLPQRDLIFAMRFRKSFGGMAGDIKMFENASAWWTKKFRDEGWELRDPEVPQLDLVSTDYSNPKTYIIHPAIDQHCFNFIPRKIHQKYPQFSEKQISGAIWLCRSRINRRREALKPPKEFEDIWKVISPDVEKMSSWVIETIV